MSEIITATSRRGVNDMKYIRNQRGLTLIEIIVSMAILAIILVVILGVFSFGFSNIAFSGQKSEELMNVQSVVDSLNARDFMTTSTQTEHDAIVNYLSGLTGKTYHSVSDSTQVSVYAGYDVNFYVSPQETVADVYGNSVTVAAFTKNGERHAQLSTFLPDRGRY